MEAVLTVEEYIPQRAPFIMVDALLACDEKTTTSIFQVQPDNLFVENGYLKEPGLLENIAQTAAMRAGYDSIAGKLPVRLGYIGAVRNFTIHGLPESGSSIETVITVDKQIFDVSVITGRASSNGKLLAECEMKIFIINQ